MTSAQRGEGGFKNCPILRTNSSDRLHEMLMRERGVKNPRNFADVICTSSQTGRRREMCQGHILHSSSSVCVCVGHSLHYPPSLQPLSRSASSFRPPSLLRPLLPAFYAFPVICCPRQSARYQLNIILDTRQEKGPRNRHFELRPRILLLIGRY